ncbi:DHS-like NAD/FAD-binding domain-containing protein [Auriscalpium vulgare]|uniref:DHS-like NAD/FAD-binding domain-containing protein n=1 Tax=Auriscalpium vulgare TaxID=40419 RepID=A0ACB8RW46_9AGAM|nr:DHS-like NAD/FAD-binding domain-containing protein [Auriscalpium vulgare]
MRLSVPNIPPAVLAASLARPPTLTPRAEAVDRVARFVAPGNVAVLTGAGVSVDSGVKAYRGKDGRYMNPDYKPIFYQQLIEDSPRGHAFRQRYWLRAYIGYAPVNKTEPNPTHYALAALQHAGVVPQLITQNVDGLHHKAIRRVWDPERMAAGMLELHGSIFKVHCKHGHEYGRDVFQEWLSEANPRWRAYLEDMDRQGIQPKTNPDGDVVLENVSYDDYVVPNCPGCLNEGRINNVIKPDFVFFGESISQAVKERSYKTVEDTDRLFVLGTTLATYSAFRLLKHAVDLKKPVLLLNVGPTRADGMPGVEKVEIPTSEILRDVVGAVVGSRARYDPILRDMLLSGVIRPPSYDSPDTEAPVDARSPVPPTTAG